MSYWVPIKLTHVPIPAVTRREDNSASFSYHPLCFYPTNFHLLEPHIHIYHEPKKIHFVEYNIKQESGLKLASKMDLAAFYNNVAYLTPVMKHNNRHSVLWGWGRGCHVLWHSLSAVQAHNVRWSLSQGTVTFKDCLLWVILSCTVRKIRAKYSVMNVGIFNIEHSII